LNFQRSKHRFVSSDVEAIKITSACHVVGNHNRVIFHHAFRDTSDSDYSSLKSKMNSVEEASQ
jgi:hypothetical protein